VIAYVPNPTFGEKKCGKMSIAAFTGEADTTFNYKFNYFADGKARTAEAISYCKGESKGAMSYTVYKKEAETTFSRKFTCFLVICDFKLFCIFT
jgi:hypothetical protein